MSPQYKEIPGLPFRRLKQYANGIWDETRKEFYPYKGATTTVPAKRGFRFFVHSAFSAGENDGDKAVTLVGWAVTVFGSTVYVCRTNVPTSSAASGVGQWAGLSQNPDILCDSNTAITSSATASIAYVGVVYAEIPDDTAGSIRVEV